jgi:formamidopyrimidine-DNA glycosylase
MPEAPEVAIMRDNLNKKFKNQFLTEINILSNKYNTVLEQSLGKLNKQLPCQIIQVYSKGKLLYIHLSNDTYIVFRPMLTGYIGELTDALTTNYYEGAQFNPSNNRVEFITSNGIFVINDSRNFHKLQILTTESKLKTELNKLGVDLLPDFDKLTLSSFNDLLCKYPNKDICDLLIDQAIIAGIGNYLRAEILYDSKIHPLTKVKKLTDKQIKDLYNSCMDIPHKVYNLHRDYRYKVYGTKDYIVKAGRKVWYNKNVQLPQ